MATMSFTKRVAITGGTFIVANALSNWVLFPDKKLDYGFLNRALGREVRSEWWGTRAAHVLAIAWPLAVMDHASIDLWNKKLLPRLGYAPGTHLSFHGTPGPLLVHGFTFALSGIMLWVAFDAAFNPAHEGKRWEAFNSKWYPEIRGVQTMWLLPVINAGLAAAAGKPIHHGTALGLIAPTLAFATVKGHSMPWPWNGGHNLSAFEREMNGVGAGATSPSTPAGHAAAAAAILKA